MRIRRIENESFSEDSSVEKNINVVKTVDLIEANMKDPLPWFNSYLGKNILRLEQRDRVITFVISFRMLCYPSLKNLER